MRPTEHKILVQAMHFLLWRCKSFIVALYCIVISIASSSTMTEKDRHVIVYIRQVTSCRIKWNLGHTQTTDMSACAREIHL